MLQAHFIDTFLKPSGALDKWKGAWEMVIRRRQGGKHFLRIIRKKKVQEFISMRYRGRVLINAPEEELRQSTMALQVMGREIELWDTVLSFYAHKKRHSRPERGPFFQGRVNPSEAGVCHGTGQCQSPWTRGWRLVSRHSGH